MKTCPDCAAEDIKAAAHVCRYCGYRFDPGAVAPDLFSARIAAGISTTAVMTAVDVFLIGALVVAAQATVHRYGAPLVLLVVSSLGFLYGTLIYANSYKRIECEPKFTRQMNCGNIVSEALGVCPLVLAVPLAVAAVTRDTGLAWSAYAISMIAFGVYQVSYYSLLRDYVSVPGSIVLLLFGIVLDAASVMALRSNTSTGHRLVIAGITVAVLAVAAVIGLILQRPGSSPRRRNRRAAGQAPEGLPGEDAARPPDPSATAKQTSTTPSSVPATPP